MKNALGIKSSAKKRKGSDAGDQNGNVFTQGPDVDGVPLNTGLGNALMEVGPKIPTSENSNSQISKPQVPELENSNSITPPTDASPQVSVAPTTPVSSVPVALVTSITIGEGRVEEIDGAGTQTVSFTGLTGTLKIDHASAFIGTISGLAGSDTLDLADLSYGASTTATFSGNTTGGTLTVTDGTRTANITLQGNYLASQWTLSSDGNGGTLVVDPVPANTWQTIKIGGSGVLSGMDIAPDGTVVVRTDTYGAYIWNGSQWQQLVTSTSMPASVVAAGNNYEGVYEIQVADSNSSIMYMMYLGEVFKTTDRGATWTLTNFAKVFEDPNDNYRTYGQKMAIDPNNPNVVYVGTPRNGMFVTQDGGVTWQSVSAVPLAQNDANGTTPGLTGILFDPALGGVTGGKTNTIFAASHGNGVYESTNGGASWNHLSGSPADVDYAAVASNGAYYVVANNCSELWRYMNGTWTELLSSYNYWVTSVAINPLNPLEVVVVGTNSSPNVSYDGGLTWTGFGTNNQATATDVPWLAGTGGSSAQLGSGALVFNPLVPNQLITTGGTGVWNTILPTNWTATTPVVWNSQTAGIEQLCANQILVSTSGHPVLASWDRSFFYVTDPNSYATTYGPVANTFAMGWSLDYASTDPSFMVGIADWWGTEQSGYSTDGGQTWTQFASMPAFAGRTIGGTIAASSPTDIVWAPANGYQPYYTLNGGISWSPINVPGVTDWSNFAWSYYLNAQTVTADRVLDGTFYLYYAGQGVFKSTDGGADWTKVFSGEISPTSYYSSKLESVPGEAGNLFFTGGPTGDMTEPFMRSTDGGTTWTAVAHVNQVSAFGFGAPAVAGNYPTIYIAGYVNGVYGIWQSDDNANSWIQRGDYPTGSLAGVRSITGDPDIYGQVYVGLAGDGYVYLPASGASAPASPVDNQAPVITAISSTLTNNQAVAASSLLTATDPDGQSIAAYAFMQVSGNGTFVVDGVKQTAGTELDLTAAQLARTIFVPVSGTEQIMVRASDGTRWSDWQSLTFNVSTTPAIDTNAPNASTTPDSSTAPAASTAPTAEPDGTTSSAGNVAGAAGKEVSVVVEVPSFPATDVGGVVVVTDGGSTSSKEESASVVANPALDCSNAALPAIDASDQPVISAPVKTVMNVEAPAPVVSGDDAQQKVIAVLNQSIAAGFAACDTTTGSLGPDKLASPSEPEQPAFAALVSLNQH